MSTGALLALLGSLGYGLSDVVSAAVVRRHATAALALWAQVTGLVLLGAAAAALRPELSVPGVLWGAGAGVVGALGVLAFYTALQRGRTSVVATVAGTGVVLPVLAGVLGGDPIGRRTALGLAAVVGGVLLVAAVPDDTPPPAPERAVPGRAQPVPVPDGCVPSPGPGRASSSVVLAAAAAVAFGLFFVVLERATELAALPGTGQTSVDVALLVALAVQAGALAVTALALTRHSRACLRPDRTLVLPAVVVGLLDLTADVAVTLAVDRGPLAVVGPLASLDPVVAVLVATTVSRERLGLQAAIGILLTLTGTVLVSTG